MGVLRLRTCLVSSREKEVKKIDRETDGQTDGERGRHFSIRVATYCLGLNDHVYRIPMESASSLRSASEKATPAGGLMASVSVHVERRY